MTGRGLQEYNFTSVWNCNVTFIVSSLAVHEFMHSEYCVVTCMNILWYSFSPCRYWFTPAPLMELVAGTWSLRRRFTGQNRWLPVSYYKVILQQNNTTYTRQDTSYAPPHLLPYAMCMLSPFHPHYSSEIEIPHPQVVYAVHYTFNCTSGLANVTITGSVISNSSNASLNLEMFLNSLKAKLVKLDRLQQIQGEEEKQTIVSTSVCMIFYIIRLPMYRCGMMTDVCTVVDWESGYRWWSAWCVYLRYYHINYFHASWNWPVDDCVGAVTYVYMVGCEHTLNILPCVLIIRQEWWSNLVMCVNLKTWFYMHTAISTEFHW